MGVKEVKVVMWLLATEVGGHYLPYGYHAAKLISFNFF
jgi:hypothetical protein